jgi:hypothetical protein
MMNCFGSGELLKNEIQIIKINKIGWGIKLYFPFAKPEKSKFL